MMPGSGTGGRRGGGKGVGDGMEGLFRSKMAVRDPEFAIDKIVHQNLSYKIHPPPQRLSHSHVLESSYPIPSPRRQFLRLPQVLVEKP